MRGGYDSAVPTTTNNGVCSNSVLGFREIVRNEGCSSWKLYGEKYYLHTMADSKSVQPCCNYRSKQGNAALIKSLVALGGIRHESVFDKRMREIKAVRARQRRPKQPSEYSTYDDNEDPAQPPLSQPLLGSLKPTCPEEVQHFCSLSAT